MGDHELNGRSIQDPSREEKGARQILRKPGEDDRLQEGPIMQKEGITKTEGMGRT